jgi:hypothetical protein
MSWLNVSWGAVEMRPLLFLLVALLVGCSYHQDTVDFGAYVENRYWRKNLWDWEGSNEGVYRTQLCTRSGDKCYEEPWFTTATDDDQRSIGSLLLLFVDHEKRTVFLNKKLGLEQQCPQCPLLFNEIDHWQFVDSNWSHSGDASFSAVKRDGTDVYQLFLLQSTATEVKYTPLLQIGDQATSTFEPTYLVFSPKDQSVAWYQCGPQCVLRSYNIAKNTYAQTPLICPYRKYFTIVWDGEVPSPALAPIAFDMHLCDGPDGKSLLPILPMPKEVPLVPGQK